MYRVHTFKLKHDSTFYFLFFSILAHLTQQLISLLNVIILGARQENHEQKKLKKYSLEWILLKKRMALKK